MQHSVLHDLIHNLAFRTLAVILTSLFINIITIPHLIRFFTIMQSGGQPIRDCMLQEHLEQKSGTVTMGGVGILLAITISLILWVDLTNIYVLTSLFVILSLGILGFIDDYYKIAKRNYDGISSKTKLVVQICIALLVYFVLRNEHPDHLQHNIYIPIINYVLDIGYLYPIFLMIVISGSSNAVNLTDGLDGLAIMPVVIAASCFAIIGYFSGHLDSISQYPTIHYVEGAWELVIFCASIIGAGLGFLWYNAPPAKIIMGDVGSLALGGALAVVSIILKQEIILIALGGIFVVETLSVIIQVCYFKFTKGQRIFLMSPIHHHFEKLGWKETTIVVRFWILSLIFSMIGLFVLTLG